MKSLERNALYFQFYIRCANFRKIGRQMKKILKWGDGSLHYKALLTAIYINQTTVGRF